MFHLFSIVPQIPAARPGAALLVPIRPRRRVRGQQRRQRQRRGWSSNGSWTCATLFLSSCAQIGRYCGAHGAPPPVLKSRGNVMALQFKTDSSVAATGYARNDLLHFKTKAARRQIFHLFSLSSQASPPWSASRTAPRRAAAASSTSAPPPSTRARRSAPSTPTPTATTSPTSTASGWWPEGRGRTSASGSPGAPSTWRRVRTRLMLPVGTTWR